MERYRAQKRGDGWAVVDRGRTGIGYIIADCGLPEHAEKIARALNQPEGAVEDRDRYKRALDRLAVYPLLTRRAGPLEQGALQIVRDALGGR